MANNRNTLLKKAFEEAAKQELKQMHSENGIVVPFSTGHNNRMKKLFNNENAHNTEKRFSFRRAFVCAAAAIALVVAVTVSAGASILNLFDITKSDNDKNASVQWVIDNSYITGEGKDEFVMIEYDGKPVTIRYSLDTGKNSTLPERSLIILVNGVRQTFDAVIGDKKYENVAILPLEKGLGTVQTAELSFMPDIGKKGDVTALEVVAVFDPDGNFYPECDGNAFHLDDNYDDICDNCGINVTEAHGGPASYSIFNQAFAGMIMNKNAKDVSDKICESFSGYAESDLDKKIYDCYYYGISTADGGIEIRNDYDSLETLCAIFYKDIDENLVYTGDFGLELQTKYVTTANKEDKYTINLHGKSGKYRVAFYIGTQPQPVFDGKEYIDVEIKDGKQVELNISIDTTKLTGENNYSVVYKHIGENLFEDFWWFTQQTCEGTISVEK